MARENLVMGRKGKDSVAPADLADVMVAQYFIKIK